MSVVLVSPGAGRYEGRGEKSGQAPGTRERLLGRTSFDEAPAGVDGSVDLDSALVFLQFILRSAHSSG